MTQPRHEVRPTGRVRPVDVERISGELSGRFRGGKYVILEALTASGVDFSGLRFEHFVTNGGRFVDCDFSRVRLASAKIGHSGTSIFVRCRFDRLRSSPGVLWGACRFEECTFEDVRFRDWRLPAAELVRCRLSGRFDGLSLYGVPQWPYSEPGRVIPERATNEFSDNDFSRADVRYLDARFGVDLSTSRWPTSADYALYSDWQQRLDAATRQVATWPIDSWREQALRFLRMHRSAGCEEQTTALVRKRDWSDIPPSDMWEQLWRELDTRQEVPRGPNPRDD